MKATKLLISLGTLALGIAGAATTYSVTLNDPVSIGASSLKAGDYKIEIQGEKAVFKSGKTVVEVPATVGTSDTKFAYTSVRSRDSKLSEIDLGGTKTKIVFGSEVQSASSSKGN